MDADFNRLVEPHLDELLAAARREVRCRVALGDLGRDDLTPEELVGETLARAWRDRDRRPALLGIRAWHGNAARADLRRRRGILGVV